MLSGILSCTTYAFMPNRLAYCGPDKNRDLFEYGATQTVDQGLKEILAEFQTLWPYLRLIAASNQKNDPFDEKVVEAYWIGNELLETTPIKDFYRHLALTMNFKKRLGRKSFEYLVAKLPLGAKPHHTFHVLNIFLRTGHHAIQHTLETMDNCRVSWGEVLEVQTDALSVLSQPLILVGQKLKLGQPIVKKIQRSIAGHSFLPEPKAGDWVSFHWGFACEKLTRRQVRNLTHYTKEAVSLANLTI